MLKLWVLPLSVASGIGSRPIRVQIGGMDNGADRLYCRVDLDTLIALTAARPSGASV